MAYFSMVTTNISSEWSKCTEAQPEDELKEIQSRTKTLEKNAVPNFRECVHKYVPHTIVEERRRRRRIIRPFTASWRWLIKQHRKNLPPTPPKQTPSAKTGPPPAHEG